MKPGDSFVARPGKKYSFLDGPHIGFPEMELIESLGHGRAGVVWCVKYGEGKLGALKVYGKRLTDSTTAAVGFNTEISFNIKDSRFVKPIAHGMITSVTEQRAILFPYVPGTVNLAEYLRDNPDLDYHQRLQILRNISGAVRRMHNEEWIHNDVKPDNVLYIDSDDKQPIRLIDFQLACEISEVEGLFGKRKGRIGTLGYVAPEIIFGGAEEVDVHSDIWSLGATAYNILTGSPIFELDSEEEFYNECFSDPDEPVFSPAKLQTVRIPVNLSRVISEMLVPRKKRRSNDLLVLINEIGRHPDSNVVVKYNGPKISEKEKMKLLQMEFPQWNILRWDTRNTWTSLRVSSKPGYETEINDNDWDEKNGAFTTYSLGAIGKADHGEEIIESPAEADIVRITLRPSGRPIQRLILRKDVRKHVRSLHFDGVRFENTKLLSLTWDGEQVIGSGRPYVTKGGERINRGVLENNDIISFDGLPTRITIQPIFEKPPGPPSEGT